MVVRFCSFFNAFIHACDTRRYSCLQRFALEGSIEISEIIIIAFQSFVSSSGLILNSSLSPQKTLNDSFHNKYVNIWYQPLHLPKAKRIPHIHPGILCSNIIISGLSVVKELVFQDTPTTEGT